MLRIDVDDSKYKQFEIGQQYRTIDSFKKVVTKYVVKNKKNIRYKKTYSKDLYVYQQQLPIEWLLDRFKKSIIALGVGRIARTKPIVKMLEMIRTSVVKLRNQDQKHSKSNYFIDQQIDLAKYCMPLPCGLGKYEVTYRYTERYTVHLINEVNCSYRLFLVSGIPCSHICSALRLEKKSEQNPRTLVSSWYTTENLKRCYESPMGPVQGMNLLKITTDEMVRSPFFKSPGGRPPEKKRKKEKGEEEAAEVGKRGIKIHYGNCGEGHNKTNLQLGILLKLPHHHSVFRTKLGGLGVMLKFVLCTAKRKPSRPGKYPQKGASSSQPSGEAINAGQAIRPQKGASSSQPTYDK
ncbi:unnamed protein product [Thlaspi arvense]|uniref:SWIM-type domain-containing protein n=1 Tax=Thlaspi arvense TaxID=13288 RepID=A0AAU9RSM9_THLAR|nr:unnamed protein product [Thlaspi arvense]